MLLRVYLFCLNLTTLGRKHLAEEGQQIRADTRRCWPCPWTSHSQDNSCLRAWFSRMLTDVKRQLPCNLCPGKPVLPQMTPTICLQHPSDLSHQLAVDPVFSIGDELWWGDCEFIIRAIAHRHRVVSRGEWALSPAETNHRQYLNRTLQFCF
jgi:hypothetical protein